jgi:branched-chain amino acid transport system substrate-binding protein
MNTSSTSVRATSQWRARIAIGSVMCAAAVGVVGCGGGNAGGSSTSAASGKSTGTVTWGANTELSGPYQVYGLPAVQGFELAAKAIDASGGITVAGKTYKIAFKAEDNRSDPSQIVNASRAVVSAGAVAALGPDLGAIPAYDVFKEAKILTFTPAFDLQQTLIKSAKANPLLFSPTVFLQNLYTTNMAQLKALYPQIKTVVIISPNDQQGQGTATAYKYAALAEGLKVLSVQTYPDGTTDFSSVLTSFKQLHPDLLVAEQTSQEAAAILQQAAQLGVAPIALNDVMTPDQALKVSGIGKMIVALPSFAPTYSPAATIPDYKPSEIFGSQQPQGDPAAAIDTYYAGRILAQAMEKAGTVTNTAAIAQALPGQSYAGPFGTCTMTQTRELSCETLMEVLKAGNVYVYRFPGPSSTRAMAKYVCQKDVCTKES